MMVMEGVKQVVLSLLQLYVNAMSAVTLLHQPDAVSLYLPDLRKRKKSEPL